jgi:aldehyde:ferredoxin oxidoreductase
MESGEGPEYETMVLMGPLCGIYDMAAITRANYRANELGLDTMSYGGTLACAMELAERGLITPDGTGRGPLAFGDAEALEALVGLTARREGLGASLAEGSYRLAAGLGRPELAMTVKKLEIPAYDPRASFTQALGYMTSPSGACHLRGGYAVSLAFFGGAKEIPRFSLLQSPIAIRNMQNIGILQDSLGVCRFTGYAFGSDPGPGCCQGSRGWTSRSPASRRSRTGSPPSSVSSTSSGAVPETTPCRAASPSPRSSCPGGRRSPPTTRPACGATTTRSAVGTRAGAPGPSSCGP